MNDLATWLRARLDEDERVARRGPLGTWAAETYFDGSGESALVVAHPGGQVSGPMIDSDAEYVARFASQTRVLAEVEAKRLILGLHRVDDEGGLDPICNVCLYAPPCETIRVLSLPYADQPGYREEWRL